MNDKYKTINMKKNLISKETFLSFINLFVFRK